MTLEDFKKFTMPLQLQYLANNGIFLCSREESSYRIELYFVEGFFVEKYFSKGTTQLLHMSSFQRNADLDPYLQQIDIPIA